MNRTNIDNFSNHWFERDPIQTEKDEARKEVQKNVELNKKESGEKLTNYLFKHFF